jgi:hypothetical protein
MSCSVRRDDGILVTDRMLRVAPGNRSADHRRILAARFTYGHASHE